MTNDVFRTLIVNSNPKFRREAGLALADLSAEVHCSASLKAALSYLRKYKVSLLMVSAAMTEVQHLRREAQVMGLDVELLFQLQKSVACSANSTNEPPLMASLPGQPSSASSSQADNLVLDPESSGLLKEDLPGQLYLCFTSLTVIKLTCFMLQAHGLWWELQCGEAPVHERYRKVLNRVRQGVIEIGADDKINWANNAFKGLLGKGDIEGHTVADIVNPADLPCLRAVRTQMRSGIISPFLIRLRDQERIVEVDASPRFNSRGVFLGTVCVMRRVEEIRAEEYEASRNLSSLYSLALSLSRAFEVSKIINIVTQTVREMCGYVCVGIKLKNYGEVVDKGIDSHLSQLMHATIDDFCNRLVGRPIRIIKDLSRDPDPATEIIKREGFKGLVCVPLTSGVEKIGHIWALADDKTSLLREKSSYLISVGVQAGMALQNAIHVQRRLEEEARRRHFYRDALMALTSGKLVFCEYDELDAHWSDCGKELRSLPLNESADVPLSRKISEECMQEQGFSGERLFDMVTCVSEAATNVVKYGPPGLMKVKAEESGIHVRLDDVGPGIAFANLPKAVLLSGYSAGQTPSLGLGYSVILELCDCVYLSTGSKGTSLILEMVHKTADPLDAFVGFTKASA